MRGKLYLCPQEFLFRVLAAVFVLGLPAVTMTDEGSELCKKTQCTAYNYVWNQAQANYSLSFTSKQPTIRP